MLGHYRKPSHPNNYHKIGHIQLAREKYDFDQISLFALYGLKGNEMGPYIDIYIHYRHPSTVFDQYLTQFRNLCSI
jgi:hypothetical protein